MSDRKWVLAPNNNPEQIVLTPIDGQIVRKETKPQSLDPVLGTLICSLVTGVGGYLWGNATGKEQGYNEGYQQGHQIGYQDGYTAGRQQGFVVGRLSLLGELQSRDHQLQSLRSEVSRLNGIVADQAKALAQVRIAWTVPLSPHDFEDDNGNGKHIN